MFENPQGADPNKPEDIIADLKAVNQILEAEKQSLLKDFQDFLSKLCPKLSLEYDDKANRVDPNKILAQVDELVKKAAQEPPVVPQVQPQQEKELQELKQKIQEIQAENQNLTDQLKLKKDSEILYTQRAQGLLEKNPQIITEAFLGELRSRFQAKELANVQKISLDYVEKKMTVEYALEGDIFNTAVEQRVPEELLVEFKKVFFEISDWFLEFNNKVLVPLKKFNSFVSDQSYDRREQKTWVEDEAERVQAGLKALKEKYEEEMSFKDILENLKHFINLRSAAWEELSAESKVENLLKGAESIIIETQEIVIKYIKEARLHAQAE